MSVVVTPQLAVPTDQEAIFRVNRWLHREVGMFLHATTAVFDPVSFFWHLPVELAYATHGTLGVVGDIFIHAATGAFAGPPDPSEIQRRAEALAKQYDIHNKEN